MKNKKNKNISKEKEGKLEKTKSKEKKEKQGKQDKTKSKEKKEKHGKQDKTKSKEKKDKKEKSEKQEKTKSKEKKEKKEKSENNTLENIADFGRKWNDLKDKESKKGTFSPEEIKKIKDAICQYAFENKLSEQDLINLVTEKQSKKDKTIWPKIAECLPERSVQSIHNFCHRSLNPFNYKGNWNEDEIKKLIK